ncbi:MAG: [LysW]-lysine hydrolase [Phycisphaeraceae bacterium]|nr:[LysW]-lysine hydrolase [Phycisphaeraceae bacterium]
MSSTTHTPAAQQPAHASPAWSDDHALDTLHDLVAIPSVSNSERAAVERFATHARTLGMEAEIDEAGSGIASRRSDESIAEIMLLGHIDTVPGDIPVSIEGERTDHADTRILHGRGSVDAKGPLCAMLFAAARATLPPGVTLRVCAAVGEETPHSRGARHIARTFRPDACIIGEPSGSDGVTLGYKGRLIVHVDAAQSCHHSAGPGDSAPDAAHAAWSRILELIASLNAANNANNAGDAPPRAFDIIQSSLRTLASSSDGLTDRASLTGGFRLPRWITPADLQSHIESFLRETRGLTLRFEGHEHAHAVDRNDPVVRALSNAIRAEGASPRPKLKTGTADLNVVAPIWNCPIAAYGPGDSSLDHTPIEHLPIAEYLRAIRILTRAIESLASELLTSRTTESRA